MEITLRVFVMALEQNSKTEVANSMRFESYSTIFYSTSFVARKFLKATYTCSLKLFTCYCHWLWQLGALDQFSGALDRSSRELYMFEFGCLAHETSTVVHQTLGPMASSALNDHINS